MEFRIAAPGRVRKRYLAAVGFLLAACEGDRTEILAPPGGDTTEAPAQGTFEAPVPLPASCLMAGSDEEERSNTFRNIALYYGVAQLEDCKTKGLTAALSDDQTVDWLSYLFNYTSALFGCGLIFVPLPGGVDAFGPGNTDAIGVPSPMMGPDDATNLIDMYIATCASMLSVSVDELAGMRRRLEGAAEARIDPDVRSRLSSCAAP